MRKIKSLIGITGLIKNAEHGIKSMFAAVVTVLAVTLLMPVVAGAALTNKIGFVSDRDGNQEIYVMDADGSNQTRLTNNPANDGSPRWGPASLDIEVTVDIKPGSCPNPLHVKGNGKLPAAILGAQDFDVRTIDVATIKLNGVAPVNSEFSEFEDKTAPASKIDACDCEALDEDTFEDLTLKFERQAIVATLGGVQNGDEIQLTLTGYLLDGTPIKGVDCVLIKGKK